MISKILVKIISQFSILYPDTIFVKHKIIYSFIKKKKQISSEKLLHSVPAGSDTLVSQVLLTQHEIPVMNLSDSKTYYFGPSLTTQKLVSDKQDSLRQCADFRSCLPASPGRHAVTPDRQPQTRAAPPPAGESGGLALLRALHGAARDHPSLPGQSGRSRANPPLHP